MAKSTSIDTQKNYLNIQILRISYNGLQVLDMISREDQDLLKTIHLTEITKRSCSITKAR
ncbi:MAG: hypothetical protein KJP00_13135 [Bacteroidia bacterium]|nr:hypothetical protein [Bacteroidia bacterium]